MQACSISQVGDPVDVVTGANTDRTRDFLLAGPLPIDWRRTFDSRRAGEKFSLGWGHAHDFERHIRFDVDGLRYVGPLGATVGAPPLRRDGERHMGGGLTFLRMTADVYRVQAHGQPEMEFRLDPDGVGRLVRLVSGSHQVLMNHDASGRLVEMIDSRGRTLRVGYDAEDRVTTVELLAQSGGEARALARYRYDARGCLVEVIDPYRHRVSLVYDAANRVVKRTDRRGYSFLFEYDSCGRCVRTRGEDGIQDLKLRYLPSEFTTVVRRSDGGEWLYSYTANGVLERIVDPYGGVRTFEYDALGRLLQEADPNGELTRYLHDAAGAPIARLGSDGRSTPLPDDGAAPTRRPHEVASTPFEWEFGRRRDLRNVSLPTASDPLLLGLRSEVLASFVISRGSGQPSLAMIRSEDDYGLLVREELPGGGIRRWTYDPNGNVHVFVDADGSRFTEEVGSWNLLQREIAPDGSYATYRYTDYEQVAEVVDAGGTRSHYAYDRKDRLTSVSRHGRVREEYRWDAATNMVAKLSGDGRAMLECGYAPGGLLRSRKLESGGAHTFEYDGKGRYVSASTDTTRTEFAYDLAGNRVLDQRDGTGVRHRFDRHNCLAESVVLERFVIRYRTEADGSVTIVDPAGGRHRLRFSEGLVRREHPNGTVETAQFDRSGRCIAKTCARAADRGRPWIRSYRYSAEGDLISVEDSQHGRRLYRYDATHRLVGTEGAGGYGETYEYDRAGNLLSGPGLSDVSIADGNRLRSANGDTFEFDSRDHMAVRRGRSGETRYAYDSRDLLVRCERVGLEWSCEYDPLGRRIAKRYNELKTTFHWDTDRLAAESSSDGTVRVYVYADALALTPLAFLEYDSLDAPAASGRRYLVFSDQLAAPRLVEDDAGRAVWTAALDPYGRAHVSSGSTIEMPLRFPGHYHDAEIDLHYNRFRSYSPELGRYLQSDPVGIAGGLNLYAYCAGSPLSRVDLRGLGCKVHGDKDDPDCEDCDNREKTKKANEQTTDAPDPAAFGEALGESVKKMPKGKTAAICDGISNSGMSQQDAATAADAASRVAFGGTGGVAQVGDDMVVLPSIIGADRPVLVVAPNGTVQSGSADVRPATPAEMASGGNILVASNVKKR